MVHAYNKIGFVSSSRCTYAVPVGRSCTCDKLTGCCGFNLGASLTSRDHQPTLLNALDRRSNDRNDWNTTLATTHACPLAVPFEAASVLTSTHQRYQYEKQGSGKRRLNGEAKVPRCVKRPSFRQGSRLRNIVQLKPSFRLAALEGDSHMLGAIVLTAKRLNSSYSIRSAALGPSRISPSISEPGGKSVSKFGSPPPFIFAKTA